MEVDYWLDGGMDDHHPGGGGGGGGGSLPMSPSWRSGHFPPHSQMGWPLSMTLADLHDDTLLPTGLDARVLDS
ncbi:hypothetical protein HPB50_011837 [Hyalomma asiaticum]|uniref:Uncharacterized protein n=1 Tax=Hyalomma asiaticum TaxID=266040 RepID=A0ACB7SMZ0_HYAAI|nr:hypothetical protein HPB50_011837 [Hyalomma asiaticum]